MQRDRGVVLIVVYKVVKGSLWLIMALVLVVLMPWGITRRMLELSDGLRHNTRAFSLALAELLLRASTPGALWIIVVALLGDALLSLIEAWALMRAYIWGPWLVVVSTGALLPFEVIAFVRHAHLTRAAVFFLNAAIVVYLARKALHERRVALQRSQNSL